MVLQLNVYIGQSINFSPHTNTPGVKNHSSFPNKCILRIYLFVPLCFVPFRCLKSVFKAALAQQRALTLWDLCVSHKHKNVFPMLQS